MRRLSHRELLHEVDTRLARSKFNRYLDASRRRTFVADLALAAVLVELQGGVKTCRDPDDDKLLETAVLGRADCIVTGDQDLLILGSY